MPEIGYYALWLALLAALGGVAAGIAGGRGRSEWSEVARRAVWATFLLTAIGVGALLYCLATFDFRLAYVAQHSARGMTLPYRMAALWGGQGGSLLLWVFISLIYASAAMWLLRDTQRKLLPWVAVALLANAAFFLALDRSPRARDQSLHQAPAGRRALRRRRPEPAAATPADVDPPGRALFRLHGILGALRVRASQR